MLKDARGEHPWTIISDLQKSNTEIVIVNFTGRKNLDCEDTSCIVEVGEHPSINKLSYIYYRRSRVVDLPWLQLRFDVGELRPRNPLTPVLLEKIRSGAKETLFLSNEVERALSIQDLI